MKAKEFRKLLQNIKSNVYTHSTLVIDTDPFDQEVERYRLKDKHIILLTEALKPNLYITELNLLGNKIGDIGAAALAELHNLETLNLSNNFITVKGVIALANSHLKKLFLGANQIYYNTQNHQQYIEMVEAFINNNTIVELNLDCSIIASKLLAQLIKHNTVIKTLHLGNDLNDEALKFIEHNNTLEELYISRNNLTDIGAEYISRNASLKTLHIKNSNIGDIGAKFLSNHTSLQKLTLIDSNITNEGAKNFFGSNLEKVIIFNGVKHNFMSSKECIEFEVNFKYAQEYKQELLQKLQAQQEYYYQITNGEQYFGINPDMNNIDSIQNAIDVLQNQWAKDYVEQHLMGDVNYSE
jgi:Leucine-rich repeat (LRR) protein